MAIINGTAGNDTRTGTSLYDTISTANGNDLVFALQGNDTVYAGSGSDTAWGGDGRDWLYGGTGRDSLYGDAGGDRVEGGNDNDYLNGGTGDDTAWGGNGADQAWGADGKDSLYGGNGADLLGGGNGDDLLQGGAGNDSVRGASGTDTAVFSGAIDGYGIVRAGGLITVTDTDTTNGDDGTDTMVDVERLQFADRTVTLKSLDLDGWFAGFTLDNDSKTGVLVNQGGAQGGVAGEFVPGQVVSEQDIDFKDVALGDLDGDGDLDAALAVRSGTESGEPGSYWMTNLGRAQGGAAGSFGGVNEFGNTTANTIALGDLDNDGDLDAVMAGGGNQSDTIAVNQGGEQGGNEGDFVGGSLTDTNLSSVYDLELGDIDGDGDLDAVMVSAFGFLIWAENKTVDATDQAPLEFELDTASAGGVALSVALGDFDGDGQLDAFLSGQFVDASSNPTGGMILSDFAGEDEPGAKAIAGLPVGFDVAAGDLDGDGDLDAVTTDLEGGGIVLAVNQGGGQGGNEGDFIAVALDGYDEAGFGLALGDLDGDGDLDILASGEGGISALLNQGGLQGGTQGTFAVSAEPVGVGVVAFLALGDLDGDGTGGLTGAGLPWLGEGLAYTNDLSLLA